MSDTRAVIAALDERGLRTGYADYWTAYPVMYLSDERIVVAPALPLAWGPGVDRHPAYTDQVDSVAEPSRLFLLVDDSCAIDPYLSPLDRAGAGYRVDQVARWRLVWDVRLPEGAEMLRTAAAAQPPCS